MMDAISGALTAVSSLMTLSKDISNAKTDHEIAVKTGELNERLGGALQQLITAQTGYLALLNEKGELEAELLKIKDWAHEKQRYQLHKTEAGGLLYRIKPEMQGAEPEHEICANCYENGIKSLLQSAPDANWHLMLACHRCNSLVKVKRYPAPTPTVRRVTRSSRFDGF
ncbi:hypothetical protein [Ectopseudomonas oleovorans]|uniref:Uncharacterized protein n=1 Tax=Ectopseudomonas oleovorans (strain CECT 5344) TaxID=1182590 RepID=W6R2C4_ECTO5|nr:hypothetical protein [Pseudomonas oleovorans]CDM42398.1 hypothetical protein BN5_3856 [Pseudomonas oleovorans CECT 5344]CDR93021.1 hypothetical protein PPSAL_3797 [Pseudomonas oleovorans]